MKSYSSIVCRENFFHIFFLNGIVPLIVFLTLTFWGLRTSGANGSGEKNLVSPVQQKYKTVTSIEADFVQTNYIASLNQTREFRGKIFLEKPSLFNMEVSQPAKQRQTFDGKYLWVYTQSNNQVVKNQVSPDFLHQPFVNLLVTMENLEKDFFVRAYTEKDSSDLSLKLTLKEKGSELREALIAVDKKSYRIKTVIIYYESGNYTKLILSKIKENKKIPPQRFQFIPPAGVEVVDLPTPQTRQ